MHEPGAVAQVMHLGLQHLLGGRWQRNGGGEQSTLVRVGASTEMTEPSIRANGKYNVGFSCALALERLPTSGE